jgi:copper resistance protein C
MPNRTLLAIAFALLTTAASAHTHLIASAPAASSSGPAPSEVTLTFSSDMEPAFSNVLVTDAKGHVVDSAPSTADARTMHVTLKPLAPGDYRVTYRAVSIDTHLTDGDFTFTVQP